MQVTADTPSHDLDLYFYDIDCVPIGSAASSAANQSGTIPSGTRYVVTHAWLGADIPVKLLAEDTQ